MKHALKTFYAHALTAVWGLRAMLRVLWRRPWGAWEGAPDSVVAAFAALDIEGDRRQPHNQLVTTARQEAEFRRVRAAVLQRAGAQ